MRLKRFKITIDITMRASKKGEMEETEYIKEQFKPIAFEDGVIHSIKVKELK